MLKLMNQAYAKAEEISSEIKKIRSIDINRKYEIGSYSFDLSDLSDKQKLFLGSLLASRLEGAKLLKDDKLHELMLNQINTVNSALATFEDLHKLEKDMLDYHMLANEAREYLTTADKKKMLSDKLKSIGNAK